MGSRGKKQAFACLTACLVLLLCLRAFAQTAVTPAGSAGLSIAPSEPESSIENQPLRSWTHDTPHRTDNPAIAAPTFDAVHVVGALAMVIGLIFGLRFVARQLFALPTARTSPLIKVLARSPLSPKQQVLLLHVGRRILVVADNGSAMQPLAQITDADEIASLLGQLNAGSALGRSHFGPLLNRLRGDFDAEEMPSSPDSADGLDSPHEQAPTEVAQTTRELQGLMEKVRLVSRRLGRT